MSSISWNSRLSQMANRVHSPEISWLMQQALEVPGMISLAAGFVDQESLPHQSVSPVLREMIEEAQSGRLSLQYGTTAGDPELRENLVDRLRIEKVFHPDASIDASNIIIGSGSQQLLYLVAETLLDENDIVLVEAPTYFVVLGVFQARGIQFIGIDTDEHGMKTSHLQETLQALDRSGDLHRVKMVYVMSYSTNPTGITLDASRRKAVLDILRPYQNSEKPILLVEDAAYRRLRFSDNPLPTIKSYDEENEYVLYTESFSKSLAPGLRLGFGVGPREIINKMIDIKGNHDFGSSNFCQQMVKRLLQHNVFDEHLKRLRQVYSEKRDVVMNILRDTFPPEAAWLNPDGGFYTWITLPPDWDTGADSMIFKQAVAQKVLYVPGALCYSPDRAESRRSSCIRLSFGMIDKETLREGCERLGKTIQQFSAVTT
jgi:2-aminoadipate transaminase